MTSKTSGISLLAGALLLATTACSLNRPFPRLVRGTDVALPVPAYTAAELARMLACRDSDQGNGRGKGTGNPTTQKPECTGFGRDTASAMPEPSSPSPKRP